MKPTVLTLFLLVCFFVYGQKEEIKLENYVLQCDALAKSLIDKETLTDITSWYEGNGKELAKRSIEELENTIDKAPVEISHYLMALSLDPLIFSLHFYETESKAEFGHMFIFFSDQENYLVDDIQFVSKSYYDMNIMEFPQQINTSNAITSTENKD